MKNNDLSWSPTFPTSILLASEDHNLYTFDIRRLSTPSQIYKAHVSAVTSCDWSPTGTEFVSGGWDRTLRIWQEGHGTHPEVYHTKRMQRVLASAFTADARYVLSGSDDGNVRVWKANASEKLGIVTARERSAIEYRDALKKRWEMDAEIGKVQRYAHSCLIEGGTVRCFLTKLMIQESAFTETRVQGWAAQTDDGRGRPRQGGAAAAAYARGREQTQGGTEESGHRRTELTYCNIDALLLSLIRIFARTSFLPCKEL
jgi:hypothetical protein